MDLRPWSLASLSRCVLGPWRPWSLASLAYAVPFMPNLTAATTRSVVRQTEERPHLLQPGQTLVSTETQLQFRVEHLLGRGGFGEVYLTRRLGQSAAVPDVVCIKASSRIDGWLREAYFGQLLDDHPRAIRVYDAFPLMQDDGRFLYCLVLEYAKHGDLSAFLQHDGSRWSEA